MSNLKKLLLRGITLKIATGLFIVLWIVLMWFHQTPGRADYALIFIVAMWLALSHHGEIKRLKDERFHPLVIMMFLCVIAFKAFSAMLLLK